MERKVYPVSQVNRYVKALLNDNRILNGIWVSGEISNYKRAASGHRYFTLKDAEGAVAAVMFASDARGLRFQPYDGQNVLAFGQITLYEKTGQYQMYVHEMETAGEGELFQAYLRLKERLEKEGLFAEERKRPLPSFVKTIGIVTSGTGAAVRDMIQISKRRFPGLQILLTPVQVQGEGAAHSIAEGIRRLNEDGRAQVLLIGRGGGSIEDLWAFNEEETVRAVASSCIPTVSAVGHETDFTLTDFAADLRAPTPSAAAELAVPDVSQLIDRIRTEQLWLSRTMHRKLDAYRKQLDFYRDRQGGRLIRMKTDHSRMYLDQTARQMETTVHHRLASERMRLDKLISELQLLDPERPLQQGYSLLYDGGSLVKSISQMTEGKILTARVKDGSRTVKVLEGEEDGRNV